MMKATEEVKKSESVFEGQVKNSESILEEDASSTQNYEWSTSSSKSTWWLQGVPQYFGHLEICNFSASLALKVKILDISKMPGKF